MTYHAKLIKGGKFVIPANLRREFGMKDGDSLVLEKEGNRLVLKTYAQVVREVQDKVRELIGSYDGSIVDELITDRRAEADAENQRA